MKIHFETYDLKNHHSIVHLSQVHGAKGYEVSSDFLKQPKQEGDFLWTKQMELPIGVRVADCTAILIEGLRNDGPFVAAIHAGWRGTADKIIETAIDIINPVVAKAWLSPSICQNHFEVGKEVLEALGQNSFSFAIASQNPEKYLLDLKGFQKQILKEKGMMIESDDRCTYEDPALFSYRRAQGQLKDRHIAWISLKI